VDRNNHPETRDQTTSTAGYDFTFSPVKSFSVLWALVRWIFTAPETTFGMTLQFMEHKDRGTDA
jgi:hypothetical protein